MGDKKNRVGGWNGSIADFSILAVVMSLWVSISFLSCKDSSQQKSDGGLGSSLGQPNFFIKKFPEARDATCDTLENNQLSFHFFDGKHDSEALFDAAGNYISTTKIIDLTELPVEARAFISSKYPKPDFSIIQLLDSVGVKIYQLELQTGTDYVNLAFDPQGKLIKETVLPLSKEEIQEAEEEGVKE